MSTTTFVSGTVITADFLNSVDGGLWGVQHNGATGDGVTDDTAALQTSVEIASAANRPMYVPSGTYLSTDPDLEYWWLYGDGTLIVDSMSVPLPPFPRLPAGVYSYKDETFGAYENAVAAGITINSTVGQEKTNVQVNGTSGSGHATTPAGIQRDHVGLFIGAYAPTPITTGASSVYTSTTLTAAEISPTTIKPGMLIDTLHAGVYTGTVRSVSGTTVTVDGWYLQGASPAAGTPANATGATINPVGKVFGQNIVASTPSTGIGSATGIELDIGGYNATGAASTVGIDMVGLGTHTPLAGFRSRGEWQMGGYAVGADVATGFVADTTPTGFEARDTSVNGFQSRVSGIVKWAVDQNGALTNDFRAGAVNSAGTYTIPAGIALVVNVSGSAVVTLPAVMNGKTITVIGTASTVVKNAGATTIATVAAGTSKVFWSDGSFWY